jgi:spore coat polysaccharide biosynthesis protein SpsF (cytidylyltransferase family)
VKRLLVVQARMGSERLPGKVLLDVGGKTMLERVLARARRAARVDEAVVATTRLRRDDGLAEKALALGAAVHRGEEDDVLDRFYGAARERGADVVVRVTADCPLIDPSVIDKVVDALEGADFAANTLKRTYPRGLDVEVCTFRALERAWREAKADHERAHVFPYIYGHPELFALRGVEEPDDHSGMRWTVDTPEDLAFVRGVYQGFGGDDRMEWRRVAGWLREHPEVAAMNGGVRQKALEEG